MPTPSCNPWPDNTVRFSDQQTACREPSTGVGLYELLDATFLATVIDALQRLAVAGVTGAQPLTDYNVCDGETNAKNAYCSLNDTTLPIQTNTAEQKQVVLWQLGNLLCANNA